MFSNPHTAISSGICLPVGVTTWSKSKYNFAPLENLFAVLTSATLPLTIVPAGSTTLAPLIWSFKRVAVKESPVLPEKVLTGCKNSILNKVPSGILLVLASALNAAKEPVVLRQNTANNIIKD